MDANPIHPIQNAAQPIQDATNSLSTLPDEDAVSATGTVNLQRSYSKLNTAIRALFDSLGIPRSASIPHLDSQDMAAHVEDVGRAVAQAGGIGSSLLTATHSVHDPDGGSTVGHRTEKAAEATVPKDSEAAKAAVAACKSLVSKCQFLLGEDNPDVKSAESTLALVGKYDMAGMTALDCGIALLGIPTPLIQKIAQLHSEHKHGGVHPILTAPKVS